jgi:hypothetical protein
MNDAIHPMVVSVIYKPAKGIEKDIDNLLLEYIMPVVNETIKPPASMFGAYLSELKGDPDYNPLLKNLDGVAVGYEILKLPSRFDESNQGQIYISFKQFNLENSLIETVQDEIDDLLNGT